MPAANAIHTLMRSRIAFSAPRASIPWAINDPSNAPVDVGRIGLDEATAAVQQQRLVFVMHEVQIHHDVAAARPFGRVEQPA